MRNEKMQIPVPVIEINRKFTGDWKKDKHIVKEIAESPMTAENAFLHAQVVMTLFNQLTYGTPSAPAHPKRSGLLRKVYDELFPIAHFAMLYFSKSSEVTICWHDGNQQFDATVEDRRQGLGNSNINYLEVTTLQDVDDAKLLARLADEKTVCSKGDHDQSNHLRKVESLKKVLESKAAIKYPPQTALLVYTDEDRTQKFSFGLKSPEIDRKNSFREVLKEMKHLLTGFSAVFIYSKNEIYCSLPMREE